MVIVSLLIMMGLYSFERAYVTTSPNIGEQLEVHWKSTLNVVSIYDFKDSSIVPYSLILYETAMLIASRSLKMYWTLTRSKPNAKNNETNNIDSTNPNLDDIEHIPRDSKHRECES